MSGLDEVTRCFAPIMGLIAWEVKRGYGSFVTMEFGAPHIVTHKPNPAKTRMTDMPQRLRRLTYTRGDWHLWIYCCDWVLSFDGKPWAFNEADGQTMRESLRFLDGQILTAVIVDPRTANTRFQFDLGGTLETNPSASGTYTEPTEQWLLYQPDGKVLTVRSDGTFQNHASNDKSEDWQSLATSEPPTMM